MPRRDVGVEGRPLVAADVEAEAEAAEVVLEHLGDPAPELDGRGLVGEAAERRVDLRPETGGAQQLAARARGRRGGGRPRRRTPSATGQEAGRASSRCRAAGGARSPRGRCRAASACAHATIGEPRITEVHAEVLEGRARRDHELELGAGGEPGRRSGSSAFCDQVDAAAGELEGAARRRPARPGSAGARSDGGPPMAPACGTRSMPPPSRTASTRNGPAADHLGGRDRPVRGQAGRQDPEVGGLEKRRRRPRAGERSRSRGSRTSIAAIARQRLALGRARGPGSRTERYVAATSAAVTGVPSWKRALGTEREMRIRAAQDARQSASAGTLSPRASLVVSPSVTSVGDQRRVGVGREARIEHRRGALERHDDGRGRGASGRVATWQGAAAGQCDEETGGRRAGHAPRRAPGRARRARFETALTPFSAVPYDRAS